MLHVDGYVFPKTQKKLSVSSAFMEWRGKKYDEKIFTRDRAGRKLISPIVSPM